MIGLFIILIITWGLLHFFEKENLSVLGILPKKNNLSQFLIGLFFITLVSLLNIYIETFYLEIEWKLNTTDPITVLNAFWYHLKSALTEDLIFRGAILFILINKIGHKKAILISAILFGIYHWFSYGILEEKVILLIYVFLITGVTGYVWSYTFYKTKSMMMGLGFHIGVNFINTCFFESLPFGELIFQEVSRIELKDWNWLFFNLFKGLFPSIVTIIFVKNYYKKYVKKNNS